MKRIFATTLLLFSLSFCKAQCLVPPQGGTIYPSYYLICSGASTVLTCHNAIGDYFEWQQSFDNVSWTPCMNGTDSILTIQTSLHYYYRRVSGSDSCYKISSNTAYVEVSATPSLSFSNITATSVTVNWSPVGLGSYSLSYSGAGTGVLTNVTPPVTLSGLTPNSICTVTVSLMNGCSGVSPATSSINTLCSAPPAPLITTNGNSITLTLVGGVSPWKVFYKPVLGAANFTSVNVTTNTYTFVGSAGTAYQFYYTYVNCPTVGSMSAPSPKVMVYTFPNTSTCATPNMNVTSPCPNKITVNFSGNPANTYHVWIRKLTPTVGSLIGYNTGPVFNYTVNGLNSNATWQVVGASVCAGVYSLITLPTIITVATCTSERPQNLILSHATCNDFTATWNESGCNGAPALGYLLGVKDPNGTVWTTINSATNVKKFTTFSSGLWKEVYVRAKFCNNYFSPFSNIEDIHTLPSGVCRTEQPDVQTESNNENEMMVFPNPTSGEFTIDIVCKNNFTGEAKLELINSIGQLLLTDVVQVIEGHLADNFFLDENYPSGIYIVKASVNSEEYISRVNVINL